MKKAVEVILFVFLAIPGSFAFVIASILLIGKIFDPSPKFSSFGELILVCVVGIMFTLVGIGKINKWMYSLVFITFPLSFWLWAIINPNMLGGLIMMLMFVGLSVFGSLRGVQYYYKELPDQIKTV